MMNVETMYSSWLKTKSQMVFLAVPNASASVLPFVADTTSGSAFSDNHGRQHIMYASVAMN